MKPQLQMRQFYRTLSSDDVERIADKAIELARKFFRINPDFKIGVQIHGNESEDGDYMARIFMQPEYMHSFIQININHFTEDKHNTEDLFYAVAHEVAHIVTAEVVTTANRFIPEDNEIAASCFVDAVELATSRLDRMFKAAHPFDEVFKPRGISPKTKKPKARQPSNLNDQTNAIETLRRLRDSQ